MQIIEPPTDAVGGFLFRSLKGQRGRGLWDG